MKKIQNQFSTYICFALMVLVASCSHQDIAEDTLPSLENPRNDLGQTVMEVPDPTQEMVIAVEFEGNIDAAAFRAEYGSLMNLISVQGCRSDEGNYRELWTINYISYQGFGPWLSSIFSGYQPPLQSHTQSNGAGGYQAHVVYQSNNSGSGGQNTEFIEKTSVKMLYGGSCN